MRNERTAGSALTRVGRGAVLVPLLLAVWAVPAVAAAYPGGSQQPPQVLGETFFRSPSVAAAATGTATASGTGGGSAGSVAFTGFDVLLFLAIAIAAVTLGLLLRRAGNRPDAR
jgi:hypothetical protein